MQHGRIADEIASLVRVGLDPTEAYAAASWKARAWLWHPSLESGTSADFVVYREDPRSDPAAARPDLVVLRGRVVSGRPAAVERVRGVTGCRFRPGSRVWQNGSLSSHPVTYRAAVTG
ncbi:hypothetical protein [Rhodococcus pyridinivorans]